MIARLAAGLALVWAALLLGGGAVAAPPVMDGPAATGRAIAVQIAAPDRDLAASTAADAPPGATVTPAPFVYPADGSIVSTETATATATVDGPAGNAAAASEATRVSLFGGEITADLARGSAKASGTAADLADSAVVNLVVLGQAVAAAPNLRVPLADWGYAVVLPQSTQEGPADALSWRVTVSGLVVHLTADHGGLLVGSEIRIGFAEAFARLRQPAAPSPTTTAAQPPVLQKSAARQPPVKRAPQPQTPVEVLPGALPRSAARQPQLPRPILPSPLVLPLPSVTPKLTAGGYVFPVYGPAAYGDTFGAARPDVSGGWHHGDDIFAPLGAPILAVADGTVFSVGWNDIGGYRLWVRDRAGNEFYYAHLSAYTTLAVNRAHVRAGDVLGFVGNSGDAQGTPYHLHFEVHPVSLLFLGYDGAVNPTRYLDAWRRLEDVTIRPAVGFAPPVAPTSRAPTPGAILLQSVDISQASGLDPASLRRAMAAPSAADLAGQRVGGLPVPVPVLDRG